MREEIKKETRVHVLHSPAEVALTEAYVRYDGSSVNDAFVAVSLSV